LRYIEKKKTLSWPIACQLGYEINNKQYLKNT